MHNELIKQKGRLEKAALFSLRAEMRTALFLYRLNYIESSATMSTARTVFSLSKELHMKKSRGEVRLGMEKSPIVSPARG